MDVESLPGADDWIVKSCLLSPSWSSKSIKSPSFSSSSVFLFSGGFLPFAYSLCRILQVLFGPLLFSHTIFFFSNYIYFHNFNYHFQTDNSPKSMPSILILLWAPNPHLNSLRIFYVVIQWIISLSR